MTELKQTDMFSYWEPVTLDDPRDQSVAGMVEEFAVTAEQETNVLLSRMLITEEYQELLEEWQDDASKATNELKELGDLVYVLYGYARTKGYDLEEAVSRIHENNMGRMKQPDGSILRRDDGKILKNKDYPKVNLNDLV